MNTADELATIELRELRHAIDRQSRYCGCFELVIRDKQQPCPKYHDCEYVRRRNGLIEQAAQIATQEIGEAPVQGDDEARTAHAYKWTRHFSITMDRLSAPLLLNGSSPNKASDLADSMRSRWTEMAKHRHDAQSAATG